MGIKTADEFADGSVNPIENGGVGAEEMGNLGFNVNIMSATEYDSVDASLVVTDEAFE